MILLSGDPEVGTPNFLEVTVPEIQDNGLRDTELNRPRNPTP